MRGIDTVGKRGPAPEPTKLKILKGNPGRRPLNTEEPEPPVETPDPPAFILKNEEALKEWHRVMPELEIMELNCRIDATILGVYCRNVALGIKADKELEEHEDGLVIYTGENNYPIPNPLIAIGNKAWAEAVKVAKEFGFTPASRSSLKVERKKQDDGAQDDAAFFRQAKAV